MAGRHIKLRLWNPGVSPTEIAMAEVGEPFWDPDNSRLGFFNNRDGNIDWYPITLVNMILNQGQKLSGKDSANATNTIMLDWGTPGNLRIVDTATNTVLAEFNAASQTLLNVASVAGGLPGITNLVANASLVVERRLQPFNSGIWSDSTLWANPQVIAPNWFGYRRPGSAGHVRYYLDTTVPTGLGAAKAARVTAKNAPTGAGVRHFVHSIKNLGGRTVTVSAWIKGPTGSQARMRVCTENGGEVQALAFTANGSWQKKTFTIGALPNDGSSWLAFDSLYTPGFAATDQVEWYVCAPQVNLSAVSMNFEVRPSSLERTMVADLFQERRIGYPSGSLSTFFNFNMVAAPRVSAVGYPNYATATLGTPTADYVEITGTGGLASLDLMANFLPVTSETP